MEMRALLLMGLVYRLQKGGMTQAEAAKALGVTQARVSDLKRGKIGRFSMDLLVRLVARAGLKPKKNWRHERPGSPLMSIERYGVTHCARRDLWSSQISTRNH